MFANSLLICSPQPEIMTTSNPVFRRFGTHSFNRLKTYLYPSQLSVMTNGSIHGSKLHGLMRKKRFFLFGSINHLILKAQLILFLCWQKNWSEYSNLYTQMMQASAKKIDWQLLNTLFKIVFSSIFTASQVSNELIHSKCAQEAKGIAERLQLTNSVQENMVKILLNVLKGSWEASANEVGSHESRVKYYHLKDNIFVFDTLFMMCL